VSDEDERIADEKARQARREADLVQLRISELHEEPIRGNFDAEHLKAIHAHIFQDFPQHQPGVVRDDTAEGSGTPPIAMPLRSSISASSGSGGAIPPSSRQRCDNLGFLLFEFGEQRNRWLRRGFKRQTVALQADADTAIGRLFNDGLSAQISPSQASSPARSKGSLSNTRGGVGGVGLTS
jgi:hypothetical protein